MTIRAAIYARYSTANQKATSIEDQIAMGEDYCKSKGWVVTQIYTDHERTGRNLNREGYKAMAAGAANREFNVVVVEAVDRLTRKVRDSLGVYDLMAFQDIRLYSIQEGGELDFINMLFLGFGAQQFSDKIADHTRRGIKGALKRGVLLSRAYGYRKASELAETNRVIDEVEARIVRRIFKMTAEGKSSYAIATALNADGVPAPTGGTWDASTIRGNPKRGEGILYNPIYIGRPQVCRNTGKYHPVTSNRKTVPSPEETVQAHFQSLQIIPDELWNATRAVIAAQRAKITNTPRDARRNTYLLSGLMTCGCCGHKYIKDSRTSYRCNEARKNACKNKKSISRKRLEKRVFDRLRSAFRSPDMLAAFAREVEAEKAKQQKGDLTAEIRRLETELRKVERAQEGIFNAIEAGGPYEKLRDRLNTWVEKEETLKAQIVALNDRMSKNLDDMPPAHIMFEQAVANMESILSNPDDVDQAHQYIKTLIYRITLTPDSEAPHGLTIRLETDLASLFLGEPYDAAEQRRTYLYC